MSELEQEGIQADRDNIMSSLSRQQWQRRQDQFEAND